jgi:hypothetical protein
MNASTPNLLEAQEKNERPLDMSRVFLPSSADQGKFVVLLLSTGTNNPIIITNVLDSGAIWVTNWRHMAFLGAVVFPSRIYLNLEPDANRF